MTPEFTVIGVSRLDDHVLLADAGLHGLMREAVAQAVRRSIELGG